MSRKLLKLPPLRKQVFACLHIFRRQMSISDAKIADKYKQLKEALNNHPFPSPWRDVAALLHESSKREPQRVENSKLIRRLVSGSQVCGAFLRLLCVPLIGTEAAYLRVWKKNERKQQMCLKQLKKAFPSVATACFPLMLCW